MNWQWTPYTILLMATSGVALLSAYYARRRRVPWIHTGIALLLAGTVWSLFYALELASPRLEAKILWSKVQYLGIVAIPIAWGAFVLQYTGREGWLKYALPVAGALSLIGLVLVWTNDRHHLMWSEMTLQRESYLGRSYPDLTKSNAIGYWYFIAYYGLTVLAGVYLLVQTIARSTSFYPRQHGFLLIGALAPILAGIASVASDTYPDHLPLVFTASTLTVLWSIAYLRRGDLVTISRRAVLQGIDDAVIVLDSGDRIISANPACQALLGHPTTEVLGQRLQEVWPELAAQLSHTAERVRQEIVLDEGADEHTYDVHISPLADWQGRPIGRVAVMRDMTEPYSLDQNAGPRAG